MAKAILFDRVFRDMVFDLRLYRYALRHQPSLLRFWPLRLLALLLSCFGIRADRLLWMYLPHCKPELIVRFWDKWAKKLPAVCHDNRVALLSRMPEAALHPLIGKGYWIFCAESWEQAWQNAGSPKITYDMWPPVLKQTEHRYIWKGKTFKTLSPYLYRRIGQGVWTFAALTGFGIVMGLISLYFATGYYCMDMYRTYLAIPLTVVLNVAPVVVLCWMLYFLCNTVWGAGLLTGLITIGFSLADYLMLILRNDPLMFSDLGYAAEGGGMVLARYHLDPGMRTYLALLLCLAAVLAATRLVRGKVKYRPVRLIALVLLSALSVWAVRNVYYSTEIYNKTENNTLTSPWSSTGRFMSRGFVYPFLNSIQKAKRTPPEDYSDKAAVEILENYTYDSLPEEKKVNIVAVMLEAYSDFSRFGSPMLTEEVYGPLNELRSRSYSGTLLTNIFAGGTVDTEWCFLTGLASASDFRTDVNSYVRYFKEQGYYAEGSHPCYQWFYNRENVNQYLGFDNYYFFENRYDTNGNGILGDDKLFQDIGDLLETHLKTSDQPYFSFSVTYQNHGPYETNRLYREGEFVIDDGYTDEEKTMMENYFSGVANTSKNVLALADRIDAMDEPVIYIVFGDHMPWMGNGNTGYQRLGIDFTGENGLRNMYETPYLIHANDAAKEVLGCDMTGEGPEISPCFLMNLVFEQAGLEGNELLKLNADMMEATPLVHFSGTYLQNGVLTDVLSEESAAVNRRFRIAQYYWRYHLQDSSRAG